MPRTTLFLAPAALALSLAATGALAQDRSHDWDADGDAMLNPAEWSDGIGETDAFEEFDVNQDGTLDRDEWGEDLVDLDGSIDDSFDGGSYPLDEETFGAASFDLYDDNDDGLLDRDELGSVDESFGAGLDG